MYAEIRFQLDFVDDPRLPAEARGAGALGVQLGAGAASEACDVDVHLRRQAGQRGRALENDSWNV